MLADNSLLGRSAIKTVTPVGSEGADIGLNHGELQKPGEFKFAVILANNRKSHEISVA